MAATGQPKEPGKPVSSSLVVTNRVLHGLVSPVGQHLQMPFFPAIQSLQVHMEAIGLDRMLPTRIRLRVVLSQPDGS